MEAGTSRPPTDLRVEVLGDAEELHERFAALVAASLTEAVAARGRASLALSRGSEALRRLATMDVPWHAVDILQADERAAPLGSSHRNLTPIEHDLIGVIRGGKPRLHAMPVTGDLEQGAAAYAEKLGSVCGSPPVCDVVHLGLGADGHTASLLPGDPALEVRDAWVAVTGPHGGFRRMTLTFPVLDAARVVVFLVSGAAKTQALRALAAEDASIPASRVRASRVHVLTDGAAWGA